MGLVGAREPGKEGGDVGMKFVYFSHIARKCNLVQCLWAGMHGRCFVRSIIAAN